MKTKHAIILIALGYCFDFVGAVSKITHAYCANNLINYEGFKKFMNN
jgi:hypothetical protein